jgi:hypothetical protein
MKKPVTDAQLAVAALIWGQAWRECMFHGGRWSDVEACHSTLYDMALLAAKEREAKHGKKAQ